MEREIKVGKVTLVVDDPHKVLGPAAPVETKAEQLGLETAKTRQEEAGLFPANGHPNPNDPMGYIGARVGVFENIAHGRGKSWALWFAWAFTALFLYTYVLFLIRIGSAASVLVGMALFLGHTGFFVHALKAHKRRSLPTGVQPNSRDLHRS